MTTSFPALPDDARIWIYASDRPLSPENQTALLGQLETFIQGWQTHGRGVQGAAQVHDDRFLMVAAHVPGGDMSGCGIDASVHAVEALAGDLGFSWVSGLTILYRDHEGRVQDAPRGAFRRLVGEGVVTAETPVFDLTLQTLAALRAGEFEQSAGASWHGRVFRIPQMA